MAEAAVRKLDDARDQKDALYREAPHNIEAEQALLGAILINNDAFTGYRTSSSQPISSSRCIVASMRSRLTSFASARWPIP